MNPILRTVQHILKGAGRVLDARRAFGAFLQYGTGYGPYRNVWTDSRFEQVRHFRHWVFIAVDRVATEIAMHQPNVSLVRTGEDPGDRAKHFRLAVRRKALTPLLSHEQLEPVRDGHPLVRLLRDPNEPDTAYDLWYETVMFLLLTGSAYWWLPRGKVKGKPGAAWVIPSHWMWANVGRERMVDSYEVRPVEGNYCHLRIPADEVIHFRRKSPVSKVDGHSPLTAGSHWVDTQESVDKTRFHSFRNGAFPGVSIELDGKVKMPDSNALDRIEAKFMARYSGEANAEKPMIVPPGARVRKLSLSPSEMAYVESADQLRDQILALFGVPAVIAQVSSDMTYGSVLAARAGFYMGTINPLYRFLGQVLTEKLAMVSYDKRLRVWWEDRTPQDPELLEKTLATDLSYGSRTMNEVRQLRGQEPYPHAWADVPWLPLNTLPVDLAIETASAKYAADGPAGSRGGNMATVKPPTPKSQGVGP